MIRHTTFRKLMLIAWISAAMVSLEVPSFGASASGKSALETTSFREHEIQAGFIFKFISFVCWPEDQPDDGTLTIAILGKNPFGDAFNSIEGTTVGSRRVKVAFFDGDADYKQLKACQLLYISSSEKANLKAIFTALDGSPTLTIGDSKRFIDKGGMIGFVKKNRDRIGIEINVTAARRARLTIRSMLKRIAVRLVDEPDSIKGGRHADSTSRR